MVLSSFKNKTLYARPGTDKNWLFPETTPIQAMSEEQCKIKPYKSFVESSMASPQSYASAFKTVVNRNKASPVNCAAVSYDYDHYNVKVFEGHKNSASFLNKGTGSKIPRFPMVKRFPLNTRSSRNTSPHDFIDYIPPMSKNLSQSDLNKKKHDNFASLPFRADTDVGLKSFTADTGCGPARLGPGSFEKKDTVFVREPDKRSAVFLKPTSDSIDVNKASLNRIRSKKNLTRNLQESRKRPQTAGNCNNNSRNTMSMSVRPGTSGTGTGKVRSTMAVHDAFAEDIHDDDGSVVEYGTVEVLVKKVKRDGTIKSKIVHKHGPTMLNLKNESDNPMDYFENVPVDTRNPNNLERTIDSFDNDFGVGFIREKGTQTNKSFSYLFETKSKRFVEKKTFDNSREVAPGSYEVAPSVKIDAPWKQSSAFLSTKRQPIEGTVDLSNEPEPYKMKGSVQVRDPGKPSASFLRELWKVKS